MVFLVFIGFLYPPPAWKVFLLGQKSSPKDLLSVVVVYAFFFSVKMVCPYESIYYGVAFLVRRGPLGGLIKHVLIVLVFWSRVLVMSTRPELHPGASDCAAELAKGPSRTKNTTQRARRGILMPPGKNCRERIFAAQLPRNYPHHGGNFERGENVLYCGGEAIWEAF